MRKLLRHAIDGLRISVGGFRRAAKDLPDRFPEYKIGRGCYGPLEIETYGDGVTLEIGAFCSFAKGVMILLGGEHRTDWISTYPFDRKYFCDESLPHSSFARGDVRIGSDVWIGTDSLILSGATIGDGAVIGARSVVRGTIPPYSICAGSPAKVLKYRFEDEQISLLLKTAWWNWPDEKIRAALPILNSGDFDAFLRLEN